MAFFAWSLRHQEDLVTRQWAQDLLVWHRRSGDTHLLTGQAAQVFLRLCQGRASTAEIRHTLLPDGVGRASSESDVEATLQDMMRLGLVTALPL